MLCILAKDSSSLKTLFKAFQEKYLSENLLGRFSLEHLSSAWHALAGFNPGAGCLGHHQRENKPLPGTEILEAMFLHHFFVRFI